MRLLLRADASHQIGTGHVMRCLALAQAWQDIGGHATLSTAENAPGIRDLLEAEGVDVVRLSTQPGADDDAVQTAETALRLGADWVVADGYRFGSRYQEILKRMGCRLLFIDDYGHAGHYSADVVLNQNLHASEHLYADREPYTRLLIGRPFLLLRREFLEWKGWERQISGAARRVMVTLGGSDPHNTTSRVIDALEQIDVEGLEVVVVVGASNRHRDGLLAERRGSRLRIEFRDNVARMSELMAWADVAVSAGGSTCWEMAFMGLPAVAIVLAENQRSIVCSLAESGAVVNAGWHSALSRDSLAALLTGLVREREARHRMSQRGRGLVDGLGAKRVAELLRLGPSTTKRGDGDCASSS